MTGTGIALDAAARGLSVALIEKGDLGSGTSSKSSKLVHGGLRYLQQREFRLVYENLYERQRLLENAPHLVSPLPFLIPLFGKDGIVSKTVARSYSSALWLYDVTGGLRIGKRHAKISKEQAARHLPSLRLDRLVAGFLYYDARGDDARVALTLARSADDRGGIIANYVEATEMIRSASGMVTGVRARACGPNDADGTEFTIAATVVVNAAGVWADEVRDLEAGTQRPSIKPAKGVHISVRADRLPCDIAAVIPVIADRRSIFVVPWREVDYTFIGTTDTAYDGPLDDPRCTQEDVAYLLSAINTLTSATLTPDDVTGVWAGLRPLLLPEGNHELRERTADLSRRHKVSVTAHGVVTIKGGKWTTYRKMAEDTVDVVMKQLGRTGRCTTKNLRLHGAPKQPPAVTDHLANRYGTDAPAVAALARPGEGSLIEGLPYLPAELRYAAQAEYAQSLSDVLSRRLRLAIQDAYLAGKVARRAAQIVGEELGWDAARQDREVDSFIGELNADLEAAGLARTEIQ
jgi:glycerol-3-phosphate dehydrogenase